MDYFLAVPPVMCHVLQISYPTYLLLSISISCQSSSVLWKLNHIRVEISSNNAVQILLIILWSLCVLWFLHWGSEVLYEPRYLREATGNPKLSLSLCLYIHFQMRLWTWALTWHAEVILFWGDTTLIASFNFHAYTSVDLERRHAGKRIVVKWTAVIFSEEYFDWLSSTKCVVSYTQSKGTWNHWNILAFQRRVQSERQKGGKLL